MPKKNKNAQPDKTKQRAVVVYKARADSAALFVRADKYVRYVLPFLDKIGEALRNGDSLKMVAQSTGTPEKVFLTWVEAYPELHSTVRINTIVALAQVESSLFENCLRRRSVEERYKRGVVGYDEDGDAVEALILEEVIVREGPGETAAQKVWLFNRSGGRWTDEKHINLKGNVGSVGSFSELVAESNDLDKFIEETDMDKEVRFDGRLGVGGAVRTVSKKRNGKVKKIEKGKGG